MLPDILMLTTQTTVPHEKQPRESAMAPNWLWLVGLENDWDVLTSEHLPGWRLASAGPAQHRPPVGDHPQRPRTPTPPTPRRSSRTAAGATTPSTRTCLTASTGSQHGSDVWPSLPRTTAAWPANGTCRSPAAPRCTGQSEGSKNARSRAADTTFDALQVADDLHAYGNSPRFGFDVYDFDQSLADFQEDRFPDGLVDAWGDTLDRSVERLRSTQRAVEARLTVDSSLTGAIANLRTQRNVIVLTVILLLLSIVTATVQIMRLNDTEPTRDAAALTSEAT